MSTNIGLQMLLLKGKFNFAVLYVNVQDLMPFVLLFFLYLKLNGKRLKSIERTVIIFVIICMNCADLVAARVVRAE